jgi:hypothetical protein
MSVVPSIDSLIRPKVWMARQPGVRVLEQRVEMFQSGLWWGPLLSMSLVLSVLAFAVAWFDLPQPFLGCFTGLVILMMIASVIIALWWRKEVPIMIFHRDKGCVSIPGHRLTIPASTLDQLHIRDVMCPDGEGGTYLATALVLDATAPDQSHCVYVWRRDSLESAWTNFRREVERMS